MIRTGSTLFSTDSAKIGVSMSSGNHKSKVLVLLTRSMVDKCFSQDDLHRLAGDWEVILPQTDDEAELAAVFDQHASDIEGLITGWGTPRLTDQMLEEADNLRVMVHAAGSIRHLVSNALWQRPIRIGTCREALAIGVAESTLGMMIAGVKGMFPASALTARGHWKHGDDDMRGIPAREMFNLTIGIVGASMAGRHVLRLLRHFEVKCLLADPTLDADEAASLGAEKVELNALMQQSDVVSLHAPALPQTRHMLGPEQFKRMRDDAIFINTARGMIVDEAALIRELQTGRIWAFLDVTDPEPPAADHPFRTLPNVVLTPHIAGALSNGCQRLGRSAVDQMLAFVADQPMEGEITASQFATLA